MVDERWKGDMLPEEGPKDTEVGDVPVSNWNYHLVDLMILVNLQH